jgi:hypothetical protein
MPAIPDRSLESFKKEAKRWLHLVEQRDPAAIARLTEALPGYPSLPTLRDIQHALARESGFDGWAELKQQLLARNLKPHGALSEFEEKVEALLDAYRTGTPAAMQRHWRLTWHRRSWEGMRTYVQIDLGKVAGPNVEITTDDARWLIAREHGFEDWQQLVSWSSAPAVSGTLLPKPIELISAAPSASPSRTRDWSDALSELAEAEQLGLDAHGQMTDALLRDIVGFEHLTSLRLNGSAGITDAGIELLVRMPNLRYLDVSGTAITDRGVAILAMFPALEQVSLAWTRVSDRGCAALGALRPLANLDLSGTAAGDRTIHALVGKPLLRYFRSGNGTTDDGLALFRHYPGFTTPPEPIPAPSLMGDARAANALTLRGSFTDRGVASLAALTGLADLDMDDRSLSVTGAGLAPLTSLPHLERLSFDAGDDAMTQIARMPALRYLACQDTRASDSGWASLGASPSIEVIWGRRCHGLSDQGFRALSTMPRLTRLSVSCLNVSDAAVALLPQFPSLRELMPMDIPDAGYRHIGRCENLESLVLMYCRDTTDVATEGIVGLPKLQKYFASYTQITNRTPELLARIDSLEEITFDSCAGLTDVGIAALARLPKLRRVSVSGRGISANVGAAFPPGIEVRRS